MQARKILNKMCLTFLDDGALWGILDDEAGFKYFISYFVGLAPLFLTSQLFPFLEEIFNLGRNGYFFDLGNSEAENLVGEKNLFFPGGFPDQSKRLRNIEIVLRYFHKVDFELGK